MNYNYSMLIDFQSHFIVSHNFQSQLSNEIVTLHARALSSASTDTVIKIDIQCVSNVYFQFL